MTAEIDYEELGRLMRYAERCALGMWVGSKTVKPATVLALIAKAELHATMEAQASYWQERALAAERVVEVAKAEVVAQGYRSSNMARALEASEGKGWFETYLLPGQRCHFTVTTETDDGPLTHHCHRPQHGPEIEHQFRPSYAISDTSGCQRCGNTFRELDGEGWCLRCRDSEAPERERYTAALCQICSYDQLVAHHQQPRVKGYHPFVAPEPTGGNE